MLPKHGITKFNIRAHRKDATGKLNWLQAHIERNVLSTRTRMKVSLSLRKSLALDDWWAVRFFTAPRRSERSMMTEKERIIRHVLELLSYHFSYRHQCKVEDFKLMRKLMNKSADSVDQIWFPGGYHIWSWKKYGEENQVCITWQNTPWFEEYFAACAMVFDALRHFEYREDHGTGLSIKVYKITSVDVNRYKPFSGQLHRLLISSNKWRVRQFGLKSASSWSGYWK